MFEKCDCVVSHVYASARSIPPITKLSRGVGDKYPQIILLERVKLSKRLFDVYKQCPKKTQFKSSPAAAG